VERAIEVDRHDLPPRIERILPHWACWPADAGIVDQDVDVTEALDGCIARLPA
jgi:hypothetical protein